MKTGNPMLSIMAGMAIGLISGVLFAPRKGYETRKKLFEKSSDLSDAIDKKIESKFSEYEGKLDELIKSLSNKTSSLVHRD